MTDATMDKDEATRIVQNWLCAQNAQRPPHRRTPEYEVVLLAQHTKRLPYGWMFYYTTRALLEPNPDRRRFSIGGNGPLIVEDDGTFEALGAYNRPEVVLADYEARRAKRGSL